jgi:hypothetical protein
LATRLHLKIVSETASVAKLAAHGASRITAQSLPIPHTDRKLPSPPRTNLSEKGTEETIEIADAEKVGVCLRISAQVGSRVVIKNK